MEGEREARDRIDALAQAGARRARAEAAAPVAGDEADRRAVLSGSRLGFFASYTGGLIAWLGSFFALAAMWLIGPLAHAGDAIMIPALLAAPWLAILALRTVAFVAGRAGLARWQAWARARPYPLVELDAALRAEPRLLYQVAIEPADASAAVLVRIRDAARGAADGAEVRDGAVIVTHRVFIYDRDVPSPPATNHGYLRWLRRLDEVLLAPLHAVHPLRAVVAQPA